MGATDLSSFDRYTLRLLIASPSLSRTVGPITISIGKLRSRTNVLLSTFIYWVAVQEKTKNSKQNQKIEYELDNDTLNAIFLTKICFCWSYNIKEFCYDCCNS
jgi:hypothetical protein